MDEKEKIYEELVILSQFAITGSIEDVRLFLARLIRKYRESSPKLSERLSKLLKDKPEGRSGVLRNSQNNRRPQKVIDNTYVECPAFLNGPIQYSGLFAPILSSELQNQFNRVISEHKASSKLRKAGLKPSSTLVFVGKPGIGKTLTAHWLANELNLPLFSIDLATIVSSFLGQTGNNLKVALDYAKTKPMVLLLDEIDSLAKTRNDDSDVGEIKRIVTVLLQEIDQWPSDSILIAATNHPEIIDDALWRRFDHIMQFELPSKALISQALKTFFMDDFKYFESYQTVLTILFEGYSFSDIERTVLEFRRTFVIGANTPEEIVSQTINKVKNKKIRLELAKELVNHADWSHYKIHNLTGVSRDTLRKYKNLVEEK
jgi:SpoVK/Ycf46/Vps4 family AAA+-type ATPase